MKKLCYCVIAFLCITLGFSSESALAQEKSNGYNPNSIHPIHESNILYKKRVWRRMDLNEKINRPFFSTNNEISRVIIEAVKAGLITPYLNDSLTRVLPKDKFLENLIDPKTVPVEDDGLSGWEDDGWGNSSGKENVAKGPFEFLPSKISILEIQEDLIFDKKRSRMYYDIQAISLTIPSKEFETGIEKRVASFRYKDLVQLFRSMPDEAIWFNRHNNSQHKNFADAFALRLFNARIIKVSNPDDAYLTDIYNKNEKEGIMASQWIENELMEFEHELWEF